MAVSPTKELELKIQSQFDCVDDWFADPTLGLKALPISGQFIRTVDFDEFISRVKAMLPFDVKLMIFDDQVLRLAQPNDTWLMIFGSKDWPAVEEGQLLPRLQPLFLREATGDPLYDTHLLTVPSGVEFRLVVNKTTHTFFVRKETETEDSCVVVVRPK